jgi:hypothetical protein
MSYQSQFEKTVDKKFQELGWRDTTEAYYGLDFTPFMSTVIDAIAEEVEKQKLIEDVKEN